MNPVGFLLLLVAATFEVGGDAVIRSGLRASRPGVVLGGMALLATYGVVVNLLRIDFGRLLGGYVAIFALVSVLWGWWFLGESVSRSTAIGLGLILLGGVVLLTGGR